jgi:hypothetical protein
MTTFRTAWAARSVAVLALLIAVVPAEAVPRTFVSATGSGAACTRAAPCSTFQAAHDATDINGEINCVDTGAFGLLIVSKSITVDCTGTVGAIQVNGSVGIKILTDGLTVRLRNLTIHGSKNIDQGIQLLAGSTLFVEHCTITGMNVNGAIIVNPNPGTTARVFVSDTVLADNPIGGISVSPNGGASARLTIDGTRIERGGIGLRVQPPFAGSPVLAHVRNSVFSNLSIGINALPAADSIASITADRTSFTLNDKGVQAPTAGGFVILGRSTVISNNTGLNPISGHIFSYQNNHMTGNVSDGAPTATLALK